MSELYVSQLETENQTLKQTVNHLMDEKNKYKQRTKQLLQVLEAERMQTSHDAQSLETITLELRQLADEKDLQLSKSREKINTLSKQLELLNSQISGQQASSSLKSVIQQKQIQEKVNTEQLKNYEQLLLLEQQAHSQTAQDINQLQQMNQVLVQTIQSFVQLFNYTIDQMDFKNKDLPNYLQRVYRSLLVSKSSDSYIIPVFIDESQCHLQLLLSSNYKLNNKTAHKVDNVYNINHNKLIQNEENIDNLYNNNYILEDQKFKLDEINFIPYKAYVVMQNFTKLNQIKVNQSTSQASNAFNTNDNQVTQNLQQSHFNQLLISLAACYQEYCSKFQFHRTNQIIQEQKREINELNRKLQCQLPYDVKRLEDTNSRIRQDLLKYQNLYKDSLGKKRVYKKVCVQVGPVVKQQLQEKRIRDELKLLRQMIQSNTSSSQYLVQNPQSTVNNLSNQSGLNTTLNNQPSNRSMSTNGNQSFNQQQNRQIEQMRNQSIDYQAGCIATGRVLLQIIELTMNKLFAMKEVPLQLMQILKQGQARCREILMEILENKFVEADD